MAQRYATVVKGNLSQYIDEGEEEFRAEGAVKPHGLASSPHYDAKFITWYLLYHTGRKPLSIGTGRGHTYNVVDGFHATFKARITDFSKHRTGVLVIG